MVHTKAQKDKVRKSGLSLQNKTQDLGRFCDVFSTLAYWNPTHERWETAMHVPRGQPSAGHEQDCVSLSPSYYSIEFIRNRC